MTLPDGYELVTDENHVLDGTELYVLHKWHSIITWWAGKTLADLRNAPGLSTINLARRTSKDGAQ